jgi:hypothetical protein
MMEFDPARFFVWMSLASTAYLAATIAWLYFLLPKAREKRSFAS